jgi:hypothetical protein
LNCDCLNGISLEKLMKNRVEMCDTCTPSYCAWCKKHMKGVFLPYGNQNVSHGICPECQTRLSVNKHKNWYRTANDLSKIKSIAQSARSSLMLSNDSLQAMCLPVSRHLAKILIDNGFKTAEVVQGTFTIDNPDEEAYNEWDVDDFLMGDVENEEDMGMAYEAMENAKYRPLHYWVMLNDIIVDITADQFNNELNEPVSGVIVDSINNLGRYTIISKDFVDPRIMF